MPMKFGKLLFMTSKTNQTIYRYTILLFALNEYVCMRAYIQVC